MDLRNTRVLSFDCYGPLIDWDRGLREQLATIDAEANIEDLLARYAVHEAEFEHASPTTRYGEIVAQAATAVAEEIGKPISSEHAARIGESVGAWPPFPDSREALARLKERFALVVLSNTDARNFAGSSAQLGDPFTGVLLAEQIGSYKPSAENFEAMERWLADNGFDASEHVHVAQSLFHDHEPGKARGWTTVWINRRAGQEGQGASGPVLDVTPDYEFPDMKSFTDAALNEA